MIEPNNVYLGDCLELMKDIPDKSIDMILCDLPYGTTQNKWDSIIDLKDLWKYYNKIIKDSGAIVLNAQSPFDKILGASNIRNLKYEWIWSKNVATGHLNSGRMPMKQHENILVFYKNFGIYNPQKTFGHKPYKPCGGKSKLDNYGDFGIIRKSGEDGSRFPKSILQFNCEKGFHPTQKPVALYEYLIKTYTNENDLVLDNCAGSGSTLVAAKNLNRRYIGIEKEEKYFNICKERLK